MIGMVDVELIKKKHFQEGWSIRHLAKVLAINRIMVRKALAASEVPRYRLSVEKPAPIMGPMKGLIEQWLKEDAPTEPSPSSLGRSSSPFPGEAPEEGSPPCGSSSCSTRKQDGPAGGSREDLGPARIPHLP